MTTFSPAVCGAPGNTVGSKPGFVGRPPSRSGFQTAREVLFLLNVSLTVC